MAEVNWDKLFNHITNEQFLIDMKPVIKQRCESPRFTQLGIFLRFASTVFKEANTLDVEEAKVLVESCFEALQKEC